MGSAGSKADLSHLQKVMNLPLAEPTAMEINLTQSFSALSVQSGLMSLAVLGKESIFSQPGASGYSLEIEDLVTVHVTGDSLYKQVAPLVQSSGNGFKMVTDIVLNTGSLVVSDALAKYCQTTLDLNSVISSGACLIRHDIQARTPIADLALEVQPNQEAAASDFMKNMLGSGSVFAGELGANFSDLLAAEYQLVPGGKARRVFWINPGITWSASVSASRFTLSQYVVLVALIHLVTDSGGSRRSLLTIQSSPSPSSSSAGAGVAAVQYGTSLRDVMASALGLPLDHVGWWKITMTLTKDQVCQPSDDLSAKIRQIFVGYMAIAATGVDQVGIQSVAVDLGTVSCSGGRRQGVSQGGATGAFDTIIAFNSSAPFLSISTLLKMPAVVSVVAVIVPAAIGGDVTDSSGQHTSEAVILTPIGAVIVASFAFIALRRFQNKAENQKPSAKPCDSVEISGKRGVLILSDSTDRSVTKASSSCMISHNTSRKECSEPACVSATLGFMMPGVEEGLRRSLDGLRKSLDLVSSVPKPVRKARDSDVLLEGGEREEHAQPAVTYSWGSDTLTASTSQPARTSTAPKLKMVPKVESDIVRSAARTARKRRGSSRNAGRARRAEVASEVAPPNHREEAIAEAPTV